MRLSGFRVLHSLWSSALNLPKCTFLSNVSHRAPPPEQPKKTVAQPVPACPVPAYDFNHFLLTNFYSAECPKTYICMFSFSLEGSALEVLNIIQLC